jgi:hypothetical protein
VYLGKERADWFQAYVHERIDMTAHRPHYPTINGPDVNVPAVARMYEVMEHRADQ